MGPVVIVGDLASITIFMHSGRHAVSQHGKSSAVGIYDTELVCQNVCNTQLTFYFKTDINYTDFSDMTLKTMFLLIILSPDIQLVVVKSRCCLQSRVSVSRLLEIQSYLDVGWTSEMGTSWSFRDVLCH